MIKATIVCGAFSGHTVAGMLKAWKDSELSDASEDVFDKDKEIDAAIRKLQKGEP